MCLRMISVTTKQVKDKKMIYSRRTKKNTMLEQAVAANDVVRYSIEFITKIGR